MCLLSGTVSLKTVVLCIQTIQYISDLGGVFGLWFGFALMTFVEICEFVSDLLLLIVYTGAVTAVQRKSSRQSQKTMTTDC